MGLTCARAVRPCCACLPADDPEWKSVTGEIEFDCNHHGVFENALDMVSKLSSMATSSGQGRAFPALLCACRPKLGAD